MRTFFISLLLIIPTVTLAAEKSAPSFNVISSAELMKLVLSLGAIIAVILVATFFIKRTRGIKGNFGQGAHVKILSVSALGVREKIVLIDVAGKQMLVGVAPGNINTLHVFDEQIIQTESDKAEMPGFAKYLQTLLQKEGGK